MRLIHDVKALRNQIADWRRGGRIAFVPTMGNLHAGHLALVEAARQRAERVVSSVFVNPMQFGAGEDFETYPRTLQDDRAGLERAGADLLFAPSVEVIYPRPPADQTRVEVPGLSDILCGAARPGHFVGVATVVCKLFNLIQPDVAVFGKKDYQQLLVIRRMVEDLNLPIEVVGLDTVREADGLAMSSRNRYLDPEERRRAPQLFRLLQATADRIRTGAGDLEGLARRTEDDLRAAGFRPDYVSIRRAADLDLPGPEDRELVILAAAHLGEARLIDNLEVTRL